MKYLAAWLECRKFSVNIQASGVIFREVYLARGQTPSQNEWSPYSSQPWAGNTDTMTASKQGRIHQLPGHREL